VVEKYNPEVMLEFRRYETPHVLIATEAMGEHHTPVTPSNHVNVVSRQHVHVWSLSLVFYADPGETPARLRCGKFRSRLRETPKAQAP